MTNQCTIPYLRRILQWAIENECELILSAAGMSSASQENAEHIKEDEEQVYAVGSSREAVKRLAEAEIPQLLQGFITGIPALLLNEGKWLNLDVIVLLVKVLKDSPDFRGLLLYQKQSVN